MVETTRGPRARAQGDFVRNLFLLQEVGSVDKKPARSCSSAASRYAASRRLIWKRAAAS